MIMLLAIIAASAPPIASSATVDGAIQKYCEPLLAGMSAAEMEAKMATESFKREVLLGQRVMRNGELIVSLSDAPKVCFIQAPTALTFEQGMAVIDRWAERFPGAIRAPSTRGPDGSPVRGWSVPKKDRALVASQQTTASGHKVMAFILAPLSALTPRTQLRSAGPNVRFGS